MTDTEAKTDAPLKNYKVTAQRHDVPEHIVDTFQVPGDREARTRFNKITQDPQWAWDWLKLTRCEETVLEMWQKI